MELTIPAYAKTISDRLKARNARRVQQSPATATAPAVNSRAAQPDRRPLGRLFRRETPSTFHRCLAVHMHFAQRASALD
ncbi:MAG TPA: hypothetical protein VN668_12430 [Stellaceae bacterium]|nr:hypothetical protein [Stellaceae bacterium]